jgi:hypothetical protein
MANRNLPMVKSNKSIRIAKNIFMRILLRQLLIEADLKVRSEVRSYTL